MKRNNSELEFMNLLGKYIVEYMPTSMNASPNTIVSYKCAFRLLFQYVEEQTEYKSDRISFEMLNYELLTGFFDWLVTERKNSRTTAKQRLGALSSFAEYAQYRNFEAGCVFRSSLGKISKKSFRRTKGKKRCSFTREELEVLFSIPDATEPLGWRDIVLLSVMYSSAARAQEICNLRVKDIIKDGNGNAILTLTGKGEKTRRVKITIDATQLLYRYIATRRIEDKPESFVFPSQRNEHLSVPAVEEIFAKYVSKAKTANPNMFKNGPYTPHVMRHTTATHLIEAGVPLAVVKNILGHSSIQTTQVYLDISQQTVDRYMEEWNRKWFEKHKPELQESPQENNILPPFLR